MKYLQQFVTTFLNVGGGIDASQTTGIVLQSLNNIDATKPSVACVTWADPLDTSVAEWITYTSINSTTSELQGVTRGAEGYSAKTHLNGAVVAFPLSKSHVNELNAAVSAEHSAAGVHSVSAMISGGSVKDEDNMASDSATALATQQSIKAYVDSGTVTMTNKTLTSPVLQGDVSGWTASTDTWTYASASTFTISGVDRTAIYTKGTRLKFTQTTVKYAVVVSSAFSTNTTVTIAVNNDYTIANAAITSPYYSHTEGPSGYPIFFNWTPTYSASGSMTYTSVTKVFAIYNISASGLLTGQFKFYGTTGGTASTLIKFTYPVAKSSTIDDYTTVGVANTELNAGSIGAIQYEVSSSSLIIRLYNSANYSLSGSQYNTGTFHYFI